MAYVYIFRLEIWHKFMQKLTWNRVSDANISKLVYNAVLIIKQWFKAEIFNQNIWINFCKTFRTKP